MLHPERPTPFQLIHRQKDHETFLRLTDDEEVGGWPEVVSDITRQILANPDWLLSTQIFSESQLRKNRTLLLALSEELPTNLDSIHGNHEAIYAFVLRFIEVFSEKYGFPTLWRGGTLQDVTHQCRGSFTFSVTEALRHVQVGFAGVRPEPCLLGLSVASLVSSYQQSPGSRPLVAEHGLDGIFNAACEIYLNYLPPDTIVYPLEQLAGYQAFID